MEEAPGENRERLFDKISVAESAISKGLGIIVQDFVIPQIINLGISIGFILATWILTCYKKEK